MSTQLVFAAWMVVSLVITAAYTGKLVSNAVPVPQQLPFQSMAELVQRDDYTWGASNGGSYEALLKVCICIHCIIEQRHAMITILQSLEYL